MYLEESVSYILANITIKQKTLSSSTMASRNNKRAARKKVENPLAQRLTTVSPSRSKSNKSTQSVKDKYNNNPLLARLDEIQKRSNPEKKGNGSQNNPLAQRLRNGKNADLVNFVPPSITKQTQTLQNQRLKKEPTTKQKRNSSHPRITKESTTNSAIVRKKTIIKIRNASNPNFLKIKNLEYGTNVKDLKVVLESMGKTKSIKVKDLASGSSLAEVIFVNEATLEQAHRQLNGAIADGRTLRTEITTESEIGIN